MSADRAPLGTLTPGNVSPRRAVPSHIIRPAYVDKPAPQPFTGSEVKSEEVIVKVRVAGKVAAKDLEEVGRYNVHGISTDEFDRIGFEFLLVHTASSFTQCI